MPASGLVLPYLDKTPQLGQGAFVAPTAVVAGDVHLGARSSVWFGAVLRGDVEKIRIGDETNIQDGAVGHVTNQQHGLSIGNRVTVGHRAVIHGCTLQDECLVGMGAVVLDGAVVETGAIVAAGALISPDKVVKTGWLWAGVPARPVRELTPEERCYLAWSAQHYCRVAANFISSLSATLSL